VKNSLLVWTAFAATVVAALVLIALTVVLWPPTLVTGLLLAALFVLPAVAILANLSRQRRTLRSLGLSARDIIQSSDGELDKLQLDALADLEAGLELRELRLARRIRTAHVSSQDYLDLLDPEPTDEELNTLLERDRELVALIEKESQLVFDRILANRYGKDGGVDTQLIVLDARDFVEKVAQLYRPDSEDILLETEIERIAKGLSSASLHMLLVIDGLPLNIKSYNIGKVYRLIRRGVSYYGTYKAFRPYLEQGLNTVQLARLAIGINPVAVGATWLAGKLATHGAKAVGERLLQRASLQLLNDFIRVLGFEAAMMYGGGFQHRDANWIFGAALVNLEISREDDLTGRDAALRSLCSLVLRNEFDRVRLLTHLSKHNTIDISKARPLVVSTDSERVNIARELATHCESTGVDLDRPRVDQWRRSTSELLGADPGVVPPEEPRETKKRRFWFRKKS